MLTTLCEECSDCTRKVGTPRGQGLAFPIPTVSFIPDIVAGMQEALVDMPYVEHEGRTDFTQQIMEVEFI